MDEPADSDWCEIEYPPIDPALIAPPEERHARLPALLAYAEAMVSYWNQSPALRRHQAR